MAYNKQGFISGQTLKADHLNHIEQGLEDIDKNKADKTDLFDKDYNSLNNKPTIPTKTSELTNDSGFVNETFVNQKVADLVNSAPETLDTLGEVAQALQENEDVVEALNSAIGDKADKSSLNNYLPLAGGAISGELSISGKIMQGTTSSDSTVANMNRYQSDLYIQGDGSAPNNPRVAGFYLGKSQSDENRHLDIVSAGDYSYIDFNQASHESDYDARLLVNVSTGDTQWMWGPGMTAPIFNVMGYLRKNGVEVATVNEVNALKPTITVDTTSGAKSLTLTTANSNTEWRYTNASGITSLTLNDSGTFEASSEAYYTVIFISGSTATTITNSMEAHFTGDDCTDGVFTPVANKTYEVGIWWNGLMWQAVVKGV